MYCKNETKIKGKLENLYGNFVENSLRLSRRKNFIKSSVADPDVWDRIRIRILA
jgi:hypothetical protein